MHINLSKVSAFQSDFICFKERTWVIMCAQMFCTSGFLVKTLGDLQDMILLAVLRSHNYDMGLILGLF